MPTVKMSHIVTIDSVTEAVRLYSGKSPHHPLVHVINLKEVRVLDDLLNTRICSNLYSVALKNADGQVRYGRNRYDFSSGVITAYAPGQTIEVEEEYQTGDLSGWFLLFHEDLLLKHPLKESIQQYGFFSYDIFEALHLSEREQQTVNRIVSEIDRETQQNQDEFSLDILLTNIELLLRYINRYFGRQFLTRKNFHQDNVETFWRLIDDHLDSAAQMESGLPTVNQLAEAMNMSPGYMSDMLRKQTGKNAQEHIQHRLIDKAKYRLLNTNDTVATIAYSLGFEYPQYFSRMFKKRTTMTPQEFRKRH